MCTVLTVVVVVDLDNNTRDCSHFRYRQYRVEGVFQ